MHDGEANRSLTQGHSHIETTKFVVSTNKFPHVRHLMPKVRDMANFLVLIYCKWWLTCPFGVDAPFNDLNLIHTLYRYEIINAEISETAIRAFSRHLWFLVPEMIPLSLFSSRVSNTDKKALAEAMLSNERSSTDILPQGRFGTGHGKPTFP